jgi:hypothetical protein
MALRLKRGEAPGLTAARPLADGTPRYRWIPGPSVRKRGFKPFYLLGAPGTAIAQTPGGWAGLGFGAAPAGCGALTVDGPPLDLSAAIAACRALSDAVKAQTAPAPAAPRPAVRIRTVNDWFADFLDACRAGRVLKDQRDAATGRRDPIGPHTIATYRKGLALLSPIIGPDDPRDLTRADLEAVFETLIHASGWHSAVRAQRSLSRAFNWLRKHVAGAAARLPAPEIYTKLNLGQPGGRLRMATPAEAEAMFRALADPAGLALELGLTASTAEIPAAAPGGAAAWRFALWTVQRVNDVAGLTDAQVRGGYLTLHQSKTSRPVHIPLLPAAREALELARATRAGIGQGEGLVFWDAGARLPYRQITGKDAAVPGEEYFKRLNRHWTAARDLAGQLEPSLIGEGLDPFGKAWKPLTLADSRDTGVTRLFEALGVDGNEARLADIAAWHGSTPERLIALLKHYLVINPAFAARGGDALERFAKASGIRI